MLEFVGEIGILRRLVLRLPWKTVIVLPLLFESLTVAAPHPKLRLFKEHSIDTLINHRFDVLFFKIGQKAMGWYNVRHVRTMNNILARRPFLHLVIMEFPVPLSRKIIPEPAP